MRKETTEEIIERKIKENGTSAEYSHIAVSEKVAGSATVGIWWYLKEGRVLKLEELPENCEKDSYVCIPQEHIKVFPFMQKQYKEEIPELLSVKYDEIERGRVWLQNDEFAQNRFVITCSPTLLKNPEAIRAIKNSFGLTGKRVKVEAQQQYDCNIKLK